MSQHTNPNALVLTDGAADHPGKSNARTVEIDVDTTADVLLVGGRALEVTGARTIPRQ